MRITDPPFGVTFALTGDVFIRVIYTFIMKLVASLSKETKDGLSVWNFYTPENGEVQFAAKADDGRNFKFYSVEKLRNYYRQMVEWGFSPHSPDDEE